MNARVTCGGMVAVMHEGEWTGNRFLIRMIEQGIAFASMDQPHYRAAPYADALDSYCRSVGATCTITAIAPSPARDAQGREIVY